MKPHLAMINGKWCVWGSIWAHRNGHNPIDRDNSVVLAYLGYKYRMSL